MAWGAAQCLFDLASRVVFVMRADQLAEMGVDRAALLAHLRAAARRQIVVDLAVLERSTGSHAGDCAAGMEAAHVSGPVVLKDCDNAFAAQEAPRGRPWVGVVSYAAHAEPLVVTQRTHILASPAPRLYGGVSASPTPVFACGAYGFGDASEFISAVKAHGFTHPLEAMPHGAELVECEAYQDWGTIADWKRFRSSWRTVFCDIDGVLVEAGNPLFAPVWGSCAPLVDNVSRVVELMRQGRTRVVLCTARPLSARGATEADLARADVTLLECDVIYGLPHAQRVVVNDVVPRRGEPTAIAVNVPRDSDTLRWNL
jgi:hypothetical protein